MPPYVSRKRERSQSSDASPPAKRKTPAKPTASRSKPTLFDAVDANKSGKSAEKSRKYLDSLNKDDDDDSSLSDEDSDEFEDVFPAKRQKTADDEDEDDEEEMDWEDAINPTSSNNATPGQSNDIDDDQIGDISISVDDNNAPTEEYTVSAGVNKKGPSKRERQIRIQSHCLHVQALLWHNTIRNSWLNDKELQKILVDGLSEGVKREVYRWREAMGMLTQEELDRKKRKLAAKQKNRRGGKAKSGGRDWEYDAQQLEVGVPNLSGGDPLLRLLKVLAAYWRKRFTVTAPGLRKQGYKSLTRLRDEVKGWQKDRSDIEEYGERIENRADLRKLAKGCEGSRDVGAQLFVALLRGLGLETRMVANLQPVGFGWSKAEEADPKKPKKTKEKPVEDAKDTSKATPTKKSTPRKPGNGKKAEPIELEDSDSSLSSAVSDPEVIKIDDDDTDLSVVDITPSKQKKKEVKKYDRDLAFPNYWIEVCSSVSNKFIPVDPMVISTIGSNDDLMQTFEPRGKKAEKAKQVICYTVAYSSDGTAKDVTVRYLKKHQLPGKTKGNRIPVEKVPVYTRKGKVKKHEEYDWFRTVISLYDRPHNKRTMADDLEEQTDLKPFKPASAAKEVEKESLQWYKQSAEFVLEAHLRREEALLPGSQSVKTFTAGKGDKAKDHLVFKRADVVSCKTVESWHKEGRALIEGEHPLKLVPMRAVTIVRKREMEDALRETGESLKQGLYSRDQTDWIIPDPIENGVIPKNAFGNMDVYVPTMVPAGAVHLPLKSSAKLCRKLQIDYAEACTGFEFGKQRAVPVLTGVVVAEEHEILVRDAWRSYMEEQKRKEDTKRRDLSLKTWRKMLLGLRVLKRVREEYAESSRADEDEINPFVARTNRAGREEPSAVDEDVGAGGFFPPGYDEEEVPNRLGPSKTEPDDEMGGGGFLVDEDDQNQQDPDMGGGGFLVEDEADIDDASASDQKQAAVTPMSLQSLHKTRADEDEDDDLSEEEEEDLHPRKPTPRSRAKAQPKAKATKPKASARKTAAKATPKKSQYFEKDDEDEAEDDDVEGDEEEEEGGYGGDDSVDDEDGDDEEEEVIRPRQTTARTRSRR